MPKLTAPQVQALRCEVNRIVLVAARDATTGAVVDLPDGNENVTTGAAPQLTKVPIEGGVDGALVAAVFDAGAYVSTMWELLELRGLNLAKYQAFNVAFDRLTAFLDDPSKAKLHNVGLALIALFSGASTLRGVGGSCGGAAVLLPGLTPPDPTIRPLNAPDEPLEPKPRPPLVQYRYNKTYGGVMLGAMGAAALTPLIMFKVPPQD